MDPPRDGLQAFDVPRAGATVVAIIVRLAECVSDGLGDGGDDRRNVKVEDGRVDVDRVGVKEGRVVEGRKDGSGELRVGGEGVLVGAVDVQEMSANRGMTSNAEQGQSIAHLS